MEANLSLMYVISLFSVLIAFAFAAYLFLWVRRQKSTNARINEVAALIKEGANTFMRKEYRVLSIFAGIAAVIIFLLLGVVTWIVWNKTRFGKNMFAVGGNSEAAEVSGVSVTKTIMGVFLYAGLMYGIASFLEGARIQSVGTACSRYMRGSV